MTKAGLRDVLLKKTAVLQFVQCPKEQLFFLRRTSLILRWETASEFPIFDFGFLGILWLFLISTAILSLLIITSASSWLQMWQMYTSVSHPPKSINNVCCTFWVSSNQCFLDRWTTLLKKSALSACWWWWYNDNKAEAVPTPYVPRSIQPQITQDSWQEKKWVRFGTLHFMWIDWFTIL